MQRLLTVESRGESQRTLALTPIGTLVTLLLYLSIGAGLFTYYVLVSRAAVVAFGLVLAGLAWGFSFFDKILWLAFKIAGVTFGSLLGVFLLGLLTHRRIADRANVYAMILMAVVNLALLTLSEKHVLPLAWSWLVRSEEHTSELQS